MGISRSNQRVMPIRLPALGSALCAFRDLMASATQSQRCPAHEPLATAGVDDEQALDGAHALGNDFPERLCPSINWQDVYLKVYQTVAEMVSDADCFFRRLRFYSHELP
jgi:hypothetical protein